jgi:hypothetical protein
VVGLGVASGGLVGIVARARKIVLTNALADKAVAQRIDGTLAHLTKALADIDRGRRRRRYRRAVAAGLGIGAAVYGAWRFARTES